MTSMSANNQVIILKNLCSSPFEILYLDFVQFLDLCFFVIKCDVQAASQNTNDNSDGWDNSGDWGEPTQDPPKMVETKKQDSWGEFEDWLSDEKSTAKKD